jgi:hypothetical protein
MNPYQCANEVSIGGGIKFAELVGNPFDYIEVVFCIPSMMTKVAAIGCLDDNFL